MHPPAGPRMRGPGIGACTDPGTGTCAGPRMGTLRYLLGRRWRPAGDSSPHETQTTRGPHGEDARRRLAILTAPLEPPPRFAMIDYDIPPPPPDEIVYIDRPVFAFSDPVTDEVAVTYSVCGPGDRVAGLIEMDQPL